MGNVFVEDILDCSDLELEMFYTVTGITLKDIARITHRRKYMVINRDLYRFRGAVIISYNDRGEIVNISAYKLRLPSILKAEILENEEKAITSIAELVSGDRDVLVAVFRDPVSNQKMYMFGVKYK